MRLRPGHDARKNGGLCGLGLTHEDAVREVLFGPRGLGQGGALRYVVDHSSISPDATREIALRLRADTGAAWVDAPVSGGVAGAANGMLAVMAGGEPEAVEHCAAPMRACARSVTTMGPTGAGQVARLCNQTFVPRMTSPTGPGIGALSTMLKDVDNVVRAAQGAQVHAPEMLAVQERFRQAQAHGRGDAGLSQIVRVAGPA